MAITFNADEIFEMAEDIERNAASFYRQAAKNTADKQTGQTLLNLAAMEDKHLDTFRLMRKELTEKQKQQMVFDPDNEAAMYLQVMADSHGTEGRISPTENLTGNETIEQLLKIAVNAEKDSIVFYVSLMDLVPAGAGKDKVQAVIDEEISHLVILKQQMTMLKT